MGIALDRKHVDSDLTCLAQIPLGSSRLDTTRWTCRAHAFWLYRACRTAPHDTIDTTGSTR